MSFSSSIASSPHDHSRCIEEALKSARDVCNCRNARMTKTREKVLRLIWQSHKPLGAYQIMDLLSEESTSRVAPPTVYRALDFLLEHQLIHRINRLNAYTGCVHMGETHNDHFMICTECGVAIECQDTDILSRLESNAHSSGFTIQSHSIEVLGTCLQCQSTPRVSSP